MLLTIDIGNSSIHCGVFDADRLRHEWRMETVRDATAEALECQLIGDRHQSRIGACPQFAIDGVVIASVVPSLDAAMAAVVKNITKHAALFVDHTNAGVTIVFPHPEKIGADRLADAAGAIAKYNVPCLVVDFGTATTFEYIDADARYHGGPIVPGMHLINNALAGAAAKLTPVPLAATDRLLPRTTTEAVQAGVFHGYVGLTRYLIQQLTKETGAHPKIIATGGFAALIAPHCPAITTVDPHLTLDGLRVIWTRNM